MASQKPFEELCLALNVDLETQNEAEASLVKFRASGVAGGKDSFEPYWPICALYVASVQPQSNTGRAGIPLSKLLSRTGFSLMSFFEPLKLFLSALGFRETIAVDLEKKFLVVSLLFDKYEQIFNKLFVREDPDGRPVRPNSNDSKLETMFRFGWYVFLMAKGKLLPAPVDFVKALHLLLACVNVLLVHSPPALLRIKLLDVLAFVEQQVPMPTSSSNEGGGAFYEPDTLLYLCVINHANYELVRDIQDRLFQVWLKTLCDNRILKFEPAKLPFEPLPNASRFYLGGLVDTFLVANEKSLTREYEVLSYEKCEFDESLFLDHHSQLRTPARGGPKGPAADSSIRGVSIPPPLTPARSILAANDWLHRELANALPQPTAALEKIYNDAGLPAAALAQRVGAQLALLQFPVDDVERKSAIAKLFYRVLEGILATEQQRLTFKSPQLAPADQGKLLAPLLKQEIFTTSILACCVEIVLATYRIEDEYLKFPAVLDKFAIPPYELTKIIECVVKTESRALPRLVVKHLVAIEERILEELGWADDSPVWHIPNCFAEPKVETKDKIPPEAPSTAVSSLGQVEPGEAIVEKFERVVQAAGSPKKPKVFALQSISSPLPKSGAKTLKSRSLLSVDLFFRKVAHLAGVRIRELISEMARNGINVTPNMLKQIEYALTYIMTKKTHLFRDRHLDQITIAVIYAICKVNRLANVNFKVIIEKYLNQPHASPKIYRNVLLLKGERGDVIKFYNVVFLPELEAVLLQFEAEGGNGKEEDYSHLSYEDMRALMSPRVPRSPQKIPNLLVSPRRTPLLFHNRDGPQGMLINIGDIQSPRLGIERINRLVQGSSAPVTSHLLSPSKLPLANPLQGAKKKLDFGLTNMDSSVSGGEPASTSQEPVSSSGRRSFRSPKPSKRVRDEDYEDDGDFETSSPSKKPRKS